MTKGSLFTIRPAVHGLQPRQHHHQVLSGSHRVHDLRLAWTDWSKLGHCAPPHIKKEKKKTMHIGFLGLGHMGAGMAANLVKAGHDVTVYNRTRAKAEALVAQGPYPK